jgi:diadenosine tetraphosphatase ApaH/serine/threonine PP2A family protein phosphatase
LNFVAPTEINEYYQLGEQKVLVNVGSVGQPRDGDNRSCYVLLDKDKRTLQFIRVDYDFGKTCEKIYDIPDLDNFLGDRLRDGR